jgi:hypothetical protein
MGQTYKKLLLIVLATCIVSINESCHKKVLPTTYPNKPGIFPIIITHKEYRLKKRSSNDQTQRSRIERKKNRQAKRNKREELKSQEKERKEHINRQAPNVQERMKKSFEESETIRGHKTSWERLMFWKKTKNKEKKL